MIRFCKLVQEIYRYISIIIILEIIE